LSAQNRFFIADLTIDVLQLKVYLALAQSGHSDYPVIPNECEKSFPKIEERFLPLVEMSPAIDPGIQGPMPILPPCLIVAVSFV
jgi:hypothetical protein